MTGSPEFHEQLRREVTQFHRSLFQQDPPADVITQYIDANEALFGSTPPDLNITQIVQKDLDVEAIEFALRRRGENPLSQKIHVLHFLLEARAETLHLFFNENPARIKAWISLTVHTLRSVYKLIKGQYLIWRHHVL